MAVAALLGTYVYAGLTTLLTTQANLGSINTAINLFSINSGQGSGIPPDVALFQPAGLSQGTAAIAAGVGFGAHTLSPILYTLSGNASVWYNPNTTAMPGLIFQPYEWSGVR